MARRYPPSSRLWRVKKLWRGREDGGRMTPAFARTSFGAAGRTAEKEDRRQNTGDKRVITKTPQLNVLRIQRGKRKSENTKK
jgi:hypothetical protein